VNRFDRATEADLDGILALMRAYYAEDGYPFEAEENREATLTLLRNPAHGALWVARSEGRVIGYLAVTLGFSLEYRGIDAFLDELYIDRPCRGRGLGVEALELAQAYCRENRVRALHLEVEPHRQVALDLYRARGFVEQERRLMTRVIPRR